ncbi:MAG TPA: class I SAM-dependent methyltransferase [Streptosporangiaceae bacterium]
MAETPDAVVRFERLLSPQGQELLGWLSRLGDGFGRDDELRVSAELRARYPADLVVDALAQHELRMLARAKFGRADEMFFTRAGLEQASSEPVARHRAGRYAGHGQVADLCCGIGGDLIALAGGHDVLAVDRDPLHLRMARANAGVHGVAAGLTTAQADVRDAGLTGIQAVFIDPARRTERGRLRTGSSEPPLGWCLSLADQVAPVGIKAAPGLAHEIVPPGWELEFVAVGRELKEAVLWSPALATAARRSTILPGGHTLTRPQAMRAYPDGAAATHRASPDAEPIQVRAPGEFLFDPNPAVTRAGLVKDLALMIGAWQIDGQIAFLSADVPVATPFARTLQVIDSAPWDQKRLPARLRALDVGAVDIRRRGLAGDVERLHKQLRLSGTRRVTLVMTRVNDRPWGLVCLDVHHS